MLISNQNFDTKKADLIPNQARCKLQLYIIRRNAKVT